MRIGARVTAVRPDGVELEGGEVVEGSAVVIATEGPEAAQLVEAMDPPSSRGVACVYFEADRPPVDEPILLLDGEGDGPVTNACVPSVVAPAYAPPGATLVSAQVLARRDPGDDLVTAVRAQLRGWFGAQVGDWRHVRTYRIPHAQPDQTPPVLDHPQRPIRVDGLYVCGDHRDNASINGALGSGRRTADAVAADLARG